jgi:hypothetical protein
MLIEQLFSEGIMTTGLAGPAIRTHDAEEDHRRT